MSPGKCEICGVEIEPWADVCSRHALVTEDYLRFSQLMKEAWATVYREKEERESQ